MGQSYVVVRTFSIMQWKWLGIITISWQRLLGYLFSNSKYQRSTIFPASFNVIFSVDISPNKHALSCTHIVIKYNPACE
jgi:hypothetical protein